MASRQPADNVCVSCRTAWQAVAAGRLQELGQKPADGLPLDPGWDAVILALPATTLRAALRQRCSPDRQLHLCLHLELLLAGVHRERGAV